MKRMSRVQRKMAQTAIAAVMALFGGPALAADSPDLAAAAKPMDEGVPQVAVLRLRARLARELGPDERRDATAKLGEALLAAGEAEEALAMLQDPSLAALPATRFWRAQALATLRRWDEALLFYQQVAAEPASPFRSRAIFGQAEAEVFFATTGTDADLVVKLIDVWPDEAEDLSMAGYQQPIAMEIFRGRYLHALDRATPLTRIKRKDGSSRAGSRRN